MSNDKFRKLAIVVCTYPVVYILLDTWFRASHRVWKFGWGVAPISLGAVGLLVYFAYVACLIRFIRNSPKYTQSISLKIFYAVNMLLMLAFITMILIYKIRIAPR